KQLHGAVIRTSQSSSPRLVWSGTEAKVLFRESTPDGVRRMVWMRLDGNGEPIAGTRVELTGGQAKPENPSVEATALLPWGEDTLAAFVNAAGTLVLTRLDAKGAVVGPAIPVASEGAIGDVVLARQGTHVVVTWFLRTLFDNDDRDDAGRLGIAVVNP